MQDDVTELGIFREAVVLLRDLAGRNVGDRALFDFFFFVDSKVWWRVEKQNGESDRGSQHREDRVILLFSSHSLSLALAHLNPQRGGSPCKRGGQPLPSSLQCGGLCEGTSTSARYAHAQSRDDGGRRTDVSGLGARANWNWNWNPCPQTIVNHTCTRQRRFPEAEGR